MRPRSEVGKRLLRRLDRLFEQTLSPPTQGNSNFAATELLRASERTAAQPLLARARISAGAGMGAFCASLVAIHAVNSRVGKGFETK